MSTDHSPIEQLVTYHTTDGRAWSINMPVEQTAKALEEFHGHTVDGDWYPPTRTHILTFNDGRMVHLNRKNVTAIEIENMEDVRARSGTSRPPDKSRRASA